MYSIHDLFASVAFPDAPVRLYHYIAPSGSPFFSPKKTKRYTAGSPPDDETIDDGFVRLNGMSCYINKFGSVCTLMVFFGTVFSQYPVVPANPRTDKVLVTDAFGNVLFGEKLFRLALGVVGGVDAITIECHSSLLWKYNRLYAAVHAAGYLDHTRYMLHFAATQPGVEMQRRDHSALKGVDADVTARGMAWSSVPKIQRVRILAQLQYPFFRQIPAPADSPTLIIYRSHPTSTTEVQAVGGGAEFFNNLTNFGSGVHTTLLLLSAFSLNELNTRSEFTELKKTILNYMKMGGVVAGDPARTLVYELVTSVHAPGGALGNFIVHSQYFELPQSFEEDLSDPFVKNAIQTV